MDIELNLSEIPEHVKESVKNSVGYSEAVNKESFLIGSSVAFSRAEEHFKATIISLSSQLKMYKESYEYTRQDIITVVEIFDRYRAND